MATGTELTSAAPIVSLTVDVEGDYGTPSLRGIDELLPGLVDRFDAADAQAVFFVVGAVARQRPEAIRALHDRGHVVASHSMTHPKLSRIDRDTRLAELRDSRAALEDVIGAPVDGFRAPYFDAPDDLGPLLTEAGYAWSSSKAPFSPVALYAGLGASKGSHRLEGSSIVEHPVPRMLGLPIPEGLSYRRLFWPLGALARCPPRVFYLHPYELLASIDGFALPWWMKPFMRWRRGAWAQNHLDHLMTSWRDRGARFEGLSADLGG